VNTRRTTIKPPHKAVLRNGRNFLDESWCSAPGRGLVPAPQYFALFPTSGETDEHLESNKFFFSINIFSKGT
jgi:hypothetical protein